MPFQQGWVRSFRLPASDFRLQIVSLFRKEWLCHKKQLQMFILLVSIVLSLFVAMLFLNVYFRVRVLKVYKKLVQNRVEFGAAHFFSQKKMEEEIYPKYPAFRTDIEIFVRHMRYSIKMATVLVALITLFGAILMYFRHEWVWRALQNCATLAPKKTLYLY